MFPKAIEGKRRRGEEEKRGRGEEGKRRRGRRGEERKEEVNKRRREEKRRGKAFTIQGIDGNQRDSPFPAGFLLVY